MSRQVVIVDDEKDLCDLLDRALRSRAPDVTLSMAHDGEAGLDLIRRIKPALAIIDVKMPRMNGYELLNQIRQDPALKNTPVMMLTSLTEGHPKSDEDWARSLDVQAFLTKPSDMEVVIKRIEELLGL